MVKLLMEHSASVSTTERFVAAPLFVAAAAGHDDVVNVLIKSEASVTDTESLGSYVSLLCCRNRLRGYSGIADREWSVDERARQESAHAAL